MTDLLCSPWATLADVPEGHAGLVSSDEWEVLLLWSSEVLWALSGRQWSGAGCTAAAVLRACPPAPGTQSWPFQPLNDCCGWWPASGYPWLFGGSYLRRGANPYAVQLPHDEVTEIVSVTVGGEPFTAYRLERSWLERTDCVAWQACGDAEVLVVYHYGRTPPAGAVRSVVALAIEAAKQACGDATCRFPKRVVSVSRQGVTLAMIDPMRFLKDRLTGLPEVDLWITSVNPYRRSSRGSVWSPDIPRAVPADVPPVP